jgi:hypothetical protein
VGLLFNYQKVFIMTIKNKNVVSDGSSAQKPKFTIKKTSKEEVNNLISVSVQDLKDQAQALAKLIDSLNRTVQADVSLSTLEETKFALAGMDACRKHMVKLRDTLKSRARTRLLEI